ncbi:MAG: hypothetical protein ABI543_03435 [Ignavibacteria bacterium]
MEFDELKDIWKENKAKNISIEPAEYNGLISRIKKAEKKVIIRYLVMSFFMAFAFYVFIGKILSVKHYDELTYIGMYLLLAAMLSVFIMVWSTVIILKKNNISNPSIDFLKNISRKLKRRTLIKKIIIPIYLAAITVGITLVYIEVLAPFTIYMRIFLHILVLIFIYGVSVIATKRENRLYEKTYKPIELKINELLNEYNEQR